MDSQVTLENVVVWSIVLLWNGYLIYKHRKSNENNF